MSQKPTHRPTPSSRFSQEEAVRKRTMWESYAVLPAKTRMRISLGICAVALAGILISDRLEAVMPSDAAPSPSPSASTASPAHTSSDASRLS
ncbi:hypothetical protein EW146_g3422 [Bondarzewia mesenterica]|uniref:Uncharacterized protein n=1 Tax=Bondarzewia mesenterica TaxID=1095465 RepID=A0A4S4LY28_9AGAM|nr:hypothetical protein EW146_g3422 [Bondarzewia mesenterica]